MKDKSEILVGNEMSKPVLEGGGGGLGVKLEKQPPSPPSPPPSPRSSGAGLLGAATPPPPHSQKIKCQSPTVPIHAHSPRPVGSPPPSGPGAEVKGKPGTPIPSGSIKNTSSRPAAASGCLEDASKPNNSNAGGRLTFFKEGRFVLELSHRTEMGAPPGWVAVKSKTYWPPPSSATTTTTQHPLRHDTPTSQSDDCSSLNSSPWTGEHVRKQCVPRHNRSTVQSHFFYRVQPETQKKRKWSRRGRRNPFIYPVYGLDSPKEKTPKVVKSESSSGNSRDIKQAILETQVQILGEKLGMKLDSKLSAKVLFEKPVCSVNAESIDPTFVSPRKRYLRLMEDQDSGHRKKLHSVSNNLSQISVDRPSSSSSSSSSPAHAFSNRSAINSQTSSAYSIDSILNNESVNRKSESFLRTLLKPEPKPCVPHSKSVPKERISNDVIPSAVKVERTERPAPDRLEQLASAQNKDRKEPVADLSRLAADRYGLGGYGSLGLASLYGINFIDPRYMMLPALAPPISSQQTEMAVAAATAAAAALSAYPLNHLTPYPPLFAGGLPGGYPPTTTAFGPLLRHQPQSSRSSPHHMAHSPSPKPPQSTSTPASPHMSSRGASPRGSTSPWQPPPPAHPFSPQKPIASPPSPPQDAPLNLSKPRSHMDK